MSETTITLTEVQVAVLHRTLGYGAAATSQAEVASGVHKVVQDGIQAIKSQLPKADAGEIIAEAAKKPELCDIANEAAQRVVDRKPK